MIDAYNSGAYNALLGAGGDETFQRVSDEIDQNVKDTEDRLQKEKNKTVADLDPLEQLLLSLDSSLNNAIKMQESKKYNFFRDEQFKRYVRDAYGVVV
jgi:hypothetical protein